MRETRTMEFKETITNTFLKTVSAFSNYDGGVILFGVDDEGNSKGLSDVKQSCLDIENKINEIKSSLEKCLEDNECYSDVFNELIDKIIVHKQNDKQIKLDIFIKTGESINTFSDNLGKKFHLIDSYTTNNSRICCN